MNKVEIVSLMHLILKLPCVTDETETLCLFSMLYFFYKHTNYLSVKTNAPGSLSLITDNKRMEKRSLKLLTSIEGEKKHGEGTNEMTKCGISVYTKIMNSN